MDTLEFLKTILPEEGVKYLALIDDKGRVAHKPFTSFEEMAAAVAKYDAQNVQVYHACGSYQNEFVEIDGKKKYRVSDNWARAKSFWIDIDCGEDKAAKGDGYATKKDAVAELKALCEKTGLPFPMVVDSGNGLHCYWALEKSIPADTWVKMASVLKAAFAHFGFLADPTATADFARILRPVGSTNKKREPKPVVTKKAVDVNDPRQFASILSNIKVTNALEVAPARPPSGINDDLTAHLAPPPNIPAYAELVADKCAQVALMRDTQGDVGYEHWRGVIGIIAHCEEGIELAHQWSARREETGHAQNDVDTKYHTWDSGPTTCKFFSQCNPAGCEGCAFKGKVKSPILLGRKEPEPEQTEVETKVGEAKVTVQVPELPSGFGYDGKSLNRYMKDKDDIMHAFTFCHTLFYPTHRICKENGEFSIGIRMHLPDQRTREFELDTMTLASPQKTIEGLAKYELVSSNHKDATVNMNAYLKESLQKLMREAEELNTYTSFGWQHDFEAFLIGDRLYCKDGTTRKVLVGGYAKDKANTFFPTPKGTLKGYADALNAMYARPGMEPLQYAIGNAFGSILTPLGDPMYKGLFFMLAGENSGKGKTTTCWAGLYAFGDADALTIKRENGATLNARYATAGVLGSIPFCMDELTHMPAEEFSQLAYTLSLGQERERLTTGKGVGTRFSEAQTWAMSAYGTGNKDFFALLATGQSNTEAEAVRLLQIKVEQYELPLLEIADGELCKQKMALNKGVAGEAFVQYCVQNLDDVLDRMRTWGKRLEHDFPAVKFRLYRNHAVKTLAALEITRDLGITQFDVETLYTHFVLSLFHDLAIQISEQNTITPEDALSRMLNDLSSRILVTNEYRDGRDSRGPEDAARSINGAVAGRYILGNSNTKDSPLAGKLYLVKKEIMDWCLKQRVDAKTMLSAAFKSAVAKDMKEKFNVGRGTKVSAGQHKCVEIDMHKLESQAGAAPKLTIHSVGQPTSGAQVVNN